MSLGLRVGDTVTPRHPEIAGIVQGLSSRTPAAVRDAVLTVRRRKSMVYDVMDPNHRSAGSFFTNPIVPDALAATLHASLGGMEVPEWCRSIPRGQG